MDNDGKRQDLLPNTSQFPNFYLDRVMQYLSGEETKVLCAAVRKILGWESKRAQLRDHISYSQFIALTGLNRTTLSGALTALQGFNIMKAVGTPSKIGQEYELNLGQLGEVDMDALVQRRDSRQARSRLRTAPARAAKVEALPLLLEAVYPIDRTPVQSIPQTGSGLSDRPDEVCPTDTQNQLSKPTTKPKEGGAETAPPPAVLVVQEVRHRFPRKDCWELIAATVGDKPADLAFWRECLVTSMLRDHNPTAYDVVLEWFSNRRIPAKSGAARERNGKARRRTITASEAAKPMTDEECARELSSLEAILSGRMAHNYSAMQLGDLRKAAELYRARLGNSAQGVPA